MGCRRCRRGYSGGAAGVKDGVKVFFGARRATGWDELGGGGVETEGHNSGTFVVSKVKTSPGHVDRGAGWTGDSRPGHWLCSPWGHRLCLDVGGKGEWVVLGPGTVE